MAVMSVEIVGMAGTPVEIENTKGAVVATINQIAEKYGVSVEEVVEVYSNDPAAYCEENFNEIADAVARAVCGPAFDENPEMEYPEVRIEMV